MKVFIALPHYGDLSAAMALSLLNMSRSAEVYIESRGSSLLPDNFNALWCMALNNRPFDKFVMLHSDIGPLEHFWLDTLIQEQERVGADVLSAIVPIKDIRGLTSTGLVDPTTGYVQRFTMHEVYNKLPPTFSIANFKDIAPRKLVVNTGLWVCDFTQPWVEDIAFCIQSSIVKDEQGIFHNVSMPEDWHFSLQCDQLGVKVFATSKIKLKHKGAAEYSNEGVWGSLTEDIGDAKRIKIDN